jgi:hypothetical protein
MCDDCSFGIEVGDGDNAIEQLLSVLEKSYNKIADELNSKQ